MRDIDRPRLAARYIRRQATQLASQLDGVRAAEDIEYVHRARVASRRLRSAFRMFKSCFPSKQLKRWRKAICQITSSLGEARDRDVQIEWLCGALAALNAKECFPGVARVLVQLEEDRERLQRKVVKAIDRIESAKTLPTIRRATKRILKKLDRDSAELPQTPSPKACRKIERHIARQRDQLFEHQTSLSDPQNRQGHHAMRIAAKRLRYTLEISSPLYAGRFDRVLAAVKQLQSMLGDIHDCDVWLDDLDAFAADRRGRAISLFGHSGRFLHLRPGIVFLRNDRHEHRQAVFAELVNYWKELNDQGIWGELILSKDDGDQAAIAETPNRKQDVETPNRKWEGEAPAEPSKS